ncbi:MAG: ABC transporter permease [Planktomarina sp.]
MHTAFSIGIIQNLRIIFALMLREMATTYGKSVMGFLWAVVEPVAGIALLAVIFALILPDPPLGTNFALFYAGGYVLFVMYLNISNKVTSALRFSKPLLGYPVIMFGHVFWARALLNFGVELIVAAIVIIGIVSYWNLWAGLDIGPIFMALSMTFALSCGVGALNCWITTVFPDWERMWAVLNRPLFIISTLLFIFESVPEPFQSALWYNPLVHIIGQMRIGMYPAYDGAFVSLIYVYGASLIAFTFGYFQMTRNYRYYVDM